MKSQNSRTGLVVCSLLILILAVAAIYEYKTKITIINQLTQQHQSESGNLSSTIKTVVDTMLMENVKAPLPSFSLWLPVGNSVKSSAVKTETGNQLHVVGDDSAYRYQAMSPFFPVLPNVNVRIELPIEVQQGQLAIGVLDENSEWLVPPQSLSPSIEFNSGDNSLIALVVANNNEDQQLAKPSRFVVSPGFYSLRADK